MYRTSRSVITLVVLSILLALPLAAKARGLENSRPAVAAGESRLEAALNWFQDVLGLRGRESHHRAPSSPAGFQTKEGSSTNGAAGGSCIDPQGGRYPPPCIIY
ncbi:MAG: hypothetical protein QOF89_1613 [Acidobacteriota bacterium]|jgi:hypothetical protein|nr:hypothetical protein [Acidobacteriota bacterium]